MKAKALALVVALASSTSALAAPFLVCDPYPTNDPTKGVPTEFVVTVNSSTTPVVVPATPATPATAGVWLHWDVATLAPGAKTVTVVARNAVGVSAASAPFSFTVAAPMPATPAGLKLQAD